MLLTQFIRKHIPGLRIIPLSTEQYVPGCIMDREKLRLLGHCRQVLPDEPESSWTYAKSEASIIYGNISTGRKMDSGIRVLGVLGLRGGFSQDVHVHIEVSDIRGAALPLNQMELQPKLNELRRTDRRGRWRQINDRLVALETFYASEFKAAFYRKNKVLKKADLEKISAVDVEADVEFSWIKDHTLVISCNDKVPFGVRGFVV